MKKLLGIIVLGLLWSGNVYATCSTDLDVSWKWVEIVEGKKEMMVTIKNKANLNIIITEIGLKSKDGTIMMSEKPYDKPYDVEDGGYPIGDEDFYVKPFRVSQRLIIVHHLNLDVAGKAFFKCKYGTKPVKTDQTSNSSSSGSSGSSGVKGLLEKIFGNN